MAHGKITRKALESVGYATMNLLYASSHNAVANVLGCNVVDSEFEF